jgi:hypothetical protein
MQFFSDKEEQLWGVHDYKNNSFLGAFVKLRGTFIGFIMSVGMEQLRAHRTDFYEIWYLQIFRKPARKIQVSLKDVLYMDMFVNL